MKKNISELKEMLEGKEMSFIDLDNIMMENGYYSVFNEGTTENIKWSQNVVYTAIDTKECEVCIDFIINSDNGYDEIEEAFYLMVTSVSEF